MNTFNKHHMVQLVTQEGMQALMALHYIDPPEQGVVDTDGDESQYLHETGELVTVPLGY